MSEVLPLIELGGISKAHGTGMPLRLEGLRVAAGDRLVLSGFSAAAAEMMVLLISGAALPDEGAVRIEGQDTRAIATDTQWLSALDRFGIVTERAVLLDTLPVAANLALPITLAIDPVDPAVRGRVDALAADVGLGAARLDLPASVLSAEERVRLHLARALALGPRILLLEHPTRGIGDRAARAGLGHALRQATDRHAIGWLAFDDDEEFAAASRGRRLRLEAGTGRLVDTGDFWRRLFR